MIRPQPHNRFITLEGGEGAGKSTLLRLLANRLVEAGFEVVVTREPGGSPIAEKIRQLIFERPVSPRAELFLFLAARAEHVTQTILPALEAGKIVLCDRFIDSTVAYQAGARGLSREEVIQSSLLASCGLHPGKTFFLDIAPMEGLKRIRHRREDNHFDCEKLAFHEKVYQAFLQECQKDPARICCLDAMLEKEDVATAAFELLQKSL